MAKLERQIEKLVSLPRRPIVTKCREFRLVQVSTYEQKMNTFENDYEALFYRSRLPLLMKKDKFFAGYSEDQASQIIFINQDRGTQTNFEGNQHIQGRKSYMISARQPGFDFRRCIYNLNKLSDNFIDAFRRLNIGLEVFDFLPKMIDMRCHMLAYHLLIWHLFVIYAPDKIQIDIYDLLSIQGGGFFSQFAQPAGSLHVCKPMKV